MCVRVIFHIRFPKKPREDKSLRALALAFFGKPQNSSVRARSDFQMPISVGTLAVTGGERLPIEANDAVARRAGAQPQSEADFRRSSTSSHDQGIRGAVAAAASG